MSRIEILYHRVMYWFTNSYNHKVQKCDGCEGTMFCEPVSGDAWLCEDCFNDYMRNETEPHP